MIVYCIKHSVNIAMHSKKLNSVIRVIITITALSNLFFCVAGVYYISTCNSIVTQEVNSAGTGSGFGAPAWRGLDIHGAASFPRLKWNSSYGMTPRHNKSVCPEIPPNLVGKLNISGQVMPQEIFNASSIKMVQAGGMYSPECKERESVAIIIPYRDRESQLEILLYHLHTYLQKQQHQYAVFVVEMALPTQFNRGMLANVGFLTAREVHNFTCYIIHDVDLLPADDRNLYRCSNNPKHLSVSSSKYGYKLPYSHYNGGVIAFTPEQYLKTNGFSNAYFGWGKEDDDLHKRILKVGYKIERPHPSIGVYEEITQRDVQDITNPNNPMKDGLYLRAENRYQKDGVNRVLFNRLALEFQPLYTWVYVNTSELLVMQMMRSIDPGLQEIYARVQHLS